MNSDVGVVWMFIAIMFFFMGMYVGTKIKENDHTKIYRRKPKPEEIRIVLENILIGLHCSPYERDCINEAIEIMGRREADAEEMDSTGSCDHSE